MVPNLPRTSVQPVLDESMYTEEEKALLQRLAHRALERPKDVEVVE